MRLQIIGKTYYSVRIALEGITFDTPKRGCSKIIDVREIPESLNALEKSGIIKIEKK